MCFDLGTWAGVATAIFTAGTAIAALWAAWIAKTAAQDSSKIAKLQTDAPMTAAKANALASRIEFYSQQIADLMERLNIVRNSVRGVRNKIPTWEAELEELKMQREHCAWWLDRQSDELGVGLRHPCGSPYDKEVPRWRGEQPTTGKD